MLLKPRMLVSPQILDKLMQLSWALGPQGLLAVCSIQSPPASLSSHPWWQSDKFWLQPSELPWKCLGEGVKVFLNLKAKPRNAEVPTLS